MDRLKFVWNVPNVLSLVRLALLPVFVVCYFQRAWIGAGAALLLSGLTDLFDVVDNGTATPGTWLPSLPADRLELVNSADVIISKGQANIECLCGCGLNVYYMLLCKCTHFARMFSVERYTGMFINESEAGKLL